MANQNEKEDNVEKLVFKNFIKRRKSDLKKVYEKIYECEFCQKRFEKGSSLGGHIST